MEMHQVRYFLSVCQTLNFTRAAEECHVAQPSLSRAIKLLELEFGGDLFRRERSLTHLTELGRSVKPSLQQCYEAAAAAKSLAKAYHKDGKAPLNLALSHSIDMALLASHLREVTTAFPNIQIKLFRGQCVEIAEKLRSGDIEVAIAGPLDDDWERFEAKKLFDEKYGVLVSRHHQLATRNRIDIEMLREYRLISCADCTMAEKLIAGLESSGQAKIARHQVPLPDDMVDLVRTEYGIGIHPLARHVPNDLSVCEIEGIELSRSIQLITVAGRQRSPATTALVNLLRARDWSQAFEPSGRPVEYVS